MNTRDFNTVVDRRLQLTKEILIRKSDEYSSSLDRLHNFKSAARIDNGYPESALWGMAKKHLVSVMDIIQRPSLGAVEEFRDEKIGDMINYLILLEALLVERQRREGTKAV